MRLPARPAATRTRQRWCAVSAAAMLLSVALLLDVAFAQPAPCQDDLQRAATRHAAAPQRASALARTAFAALEPAYPTSRTPRDGVDTNAAWLDARRMLPSTWSTDHLDLETWRALLANLQRPYGVEPAPLTGTLDADAMLADTQAALAAAAASLRPLALLATDDGDENRVAFAAVIWNWTPYPRLLLFPLRGKILEDGRATESLLAHLGTCAWTARSWMAAGETRVGDYYLGNAATDIILLARGEDTVRMPVPDDQVRDTFRLTTPGLTGVDAAALVFTGPGPSLTQIIGLLLSVRANVTVLDLPYYLTIPER